METLKYEPKRISDFEFFVKFIFIIAFGVYLFLLGVEINAGVGILNIVAMYILIHFSISLEDNSRAIKLSNK